MFIFIFIFLIVHLIATAGYTDLRPSTTEREIKWFTLISAIGIIVVFFTFPSIMEMLIIGVVLYEIIGLLIIFIGAINYKKNKEKEMENYN